MEGASSLAAMRVLGGPAGRRRAERRDGASGGMMSMGSEYVSLALVATEALPALVAPAPLAFGIGGGRLWLPESDSIESVGAPAGSTLADGLLAASAGLGGAGGVADIGKTGGLGVSGVVATGAADASGAAGDCLTNGGSAGGFVAEAPLSGASVKLCGWVLTAPDPAADFCS